jgi:hypothetical protein
MFGALGVRLVDYILLNPYRFERNLFGCVTERG